jgi:ABC-type phosphate transport system auxiliary subunit
MPKDQNQQYLATKLKNYRQRLDQLTGQLLESFESNDQIKQYELQQLINALTVKIESVNIRIDRSQQKLQDYDCEIFRIPLLTNNHNQYK